MLIFKHGTENNVYVKTSTGHLDVINAGALKYFICAYNLTRCVALPR